jgi:hypothetical protein
MEAFGGMGESPAWLEPEVISADGEHTHEQQAMMSGVAIESAPISTNGKDEAAPGTVPHAQPGYPGPDPAVRDYVNRQAVQARNGMSLPHMVQQNPDIPTNNYSYRTTNPYNYYAGDQWSGDEPSMFKYGITDTLIAVSGAAAGIAMDSMVAKKIGMKGYGPLAGVFLFTAGSSMITLAKRQGWKPAAKVGAGAVLGYLPVIGAIAMKRKMNKETAIALSLIGVVGAVGITMMKRNQA